MTRDIDDDAHESEMTADPDNHSSLNAKVHIAPDPVKTYNSQAHGDLDVGSGSDVCSPLSPNLLSDPVMWSELSQSDIIYWMASGLASC